jgi:predicted AAA+ superfamily ATPase
MPSTLSEIQADPKSFIENNSKIVIDEVQKYPELLSYIQAVVDERKIMADFVISGSENLLLSEKISQSLAGRVGYIKMYPFSFNELKSVKKLENNWKEQIFK